MCVCVCVCVRVRARVHTMFVREFSHSSSSSWCLQCFTSFWSACLLSYLTSQAASGSYVPPPSVWMVYSPLSVWMVCSPLSVDLSVSGWCTLLFYLPYSPLIGNEHPYPPCGGVTSGRVTPPPFHLSCCAGQCCCCCCWLGPAGRGSW